MALSQALSLSKAKRRSLGWAWKPADGSWSETLLGLDLSATRGAAERRARKRHPRGGFCTGRVMSCGHGPRILLEVEAIVCSTEVGARLQGAPKNPCSCAEAVAV